MLTLSKIFFFFLVWHPVKIKILLARVVLTQFAERKKPRHALFVKKRFDVGINENIHMQKFSMYTKFYYTALLQSIFDWRFLIKLEIYYQNHLNHKISLINNKQNWRSNKAGRIKKNHRCNFFSFSFFSPKIFCPVE